MKAIKHILAYAMFAVTIMAVTPSQSLFTNAS